MTARTYTADDVYKVMAQRCTCNILWDNVRFDVYAFNEEDIWLYDETGDELHTTHEEIAQSLNNGDTIEFYKLEKVEI